MKNRQLSILGSTMAITAFLTVGAGVAPDTVAGAAITHDPSALPASTSNVQMLNVRQELAKMSTVHTTNTLVSGKLETILVNSRGLPLYYYEGDTAKKSFVNGQLARLWPPLLTAHPTAVGARGALTSLKVAAGLQVTYNGHFLYTFVEDSPGHVSGEGVSNFLVATPRLKEIRSATKVTTTTSASGGFRY